MVPPAALQNFFDDTMVRESGHIDPQGTYVPTIKIETRRNLRGIGIGPTADVRTHSAIASVKGRT